MQALQIVSHIDLVFQDTVAGVTAIGIKSVSILVGPWYCTFGQRVKRYAANIW
jgi:hypothetical protein